MSSEKPGELGYTDFGAVIGYERKLPEPGVAVLELKLEQHHCNRLGTIHGGVIMAMLDAAGMWAGSDSGKAPVCPTVSISCSFLKAVTLAKFQTVCARAEITRKGRRLYFANVTAYAGSEIVATAQGVYAMPS